MSAARSLKLVSVDEYLSKERESPVKHEYLAGQVFAMAGGTVRHNQIAVNLLVGLQTRLRGGPCRAQNSDMKVRIRTAARVYFYYPDVSVVCESNREDEHFQDRPVAVFEVLSPSTRRTDVTEKVEGYTNIPALHSYAIVEQDEPAIVVYRRTEQGFAPEVSAGLDAVLRLPEIGVELPLAEIYEGIEFPPPAADDA